ncbi:MAG TPA: phosphotransferase [Micromonosporaceae bacterium]|jgi:aminoglycoside phosphotransferase (APT) family kinase protein
MIGAGRDADVFAYRTGLVLRRYRDGRSAQREAQLQQEMHERGFPVPAVVSTDGPDIVMERIEGPDLSQAMLAGTSIDEAAQTLVQLHDNLHALAWPGGQPLLHLDLHPLNVIVSATGPVLIDWANARPGPPGLDLAVTALILAQAATTHGMAAMVAAPPDFVVAAARALLTAFADRTTTPYAEHLAEAERVREKDPRQSPAEVALLPQAVALARLVHPS